MALHHIGIAGQFLVQAKAAGAKVHERIEPEDALQNRAHAICECAATTSSEVCGLVFHSTSMTSDSASLIEID